MNTSVISPLSMHRVEDHPVGLGSRALLSISAERSVRADRQRILRALTLPEYMETWFCVPGVRPGRTSVSLLEDSFLISCFCTERSTFHILCNYKVCRRGKLIFTWSRGNGIASGLVTIRLLGDFGRTTVQVTHSGLHHSEANWHQELWENSLEKLSSLF